jgi:hypothetical protein
MKSAATLSGKSGIDSAPIAPGLVSQFADLDDSTEGWPLSERVVRFHVGAGVDRYRAASRPPHDKLNDVFKGKIGATHARPGA